MASKPPPHHITVEDIGDIAVVGFRDKRITEDLNIQAVGDDLVRLVDELGRRKVLLNFENVEFMSSAMFGKLPGLQNKLGALQGKLVLCGLRKNLMDAMRLFTFDRKFTILPDQATGLQAF